MDNDEYKEEFDDEDEDDDGDEEYSDSDLAKDSPFEKFYQQNSELFPADFRETMDKFLEHKYYFFELEPEFTEAIDGPLTRLMKQHYPCLEEKTDPQVLELIHSINDMVTAEMIGPVRYMLEDITNGIDFKVKYPQFERWRDFYGKPADVDEVPEITRYVWFEGSDEEWEAYKADEISKMRQYNRWCESRLQAFYDIVQPKVFEAFPNLINIEGDAWVIYAMHIRDAYEQWKTRCESLELIIEYEMPVESYHWSVDKFDEAMKKVAPELKKRYDDNRNARIDAHP